MTNATLISENELSCRRILRTICAAGEGSCETECGGPPNIIPTVGFEGYQIINDLVLSVSEADGVLANDYDPDGPLDLTAHLYEDALHGDLTLNLNGSFTYDPFDNYIGDDFFTYFASDGEDASETISVYLVINGVDIQFQDGANEPEYEFGWSSLLWTSPTGVWTGELIKLRSKVIGVPVWNLVTSHDWQLDDKAIGWWGSEYDYYLVTCLDPTRYQGLN